MPGGHRFSSGDFKYAGGNGGWWTATEGSNGSAYSRGMYYNGNGLYEGSGNKSYGFSVRCVQD